MKTTQLLMDRLQETFNDMALSNKELLMLNEQSIKACDKLLSFLDSKIGKEK
ncbi:hypothetical protein [Neobacillus mesonae]|uniref:hypothetical protein n=1 Tax=Neobacillus mesonae TaxID=1193713 RepID=UPI00257390AF|nr:hypothetical protein [Neobacillus mesonae]